MTQETSASDTTATQTSETTATTDAAETANVETGAATGAADADTDGILGSAADAGAGDGAGDGEAADAADAGAEAAADAGLPEKYELTAPEGFEINETVLADATPVFQELGLGQEQAQKLVPLGQKLIENYESAKADEYAALRTQWANEVKADAEIGKGNLRETQRLAARALDTFIGPREILGEDGKPIIGQDGKPVIEPFRQLLIETGLENHPVMVRAFRKIGMALSEDGTIARGGQGPATPKSREQILYPDDAPKAAEA